MKMRVLFKHLDKSSGALQTLEFKPFDRYDSISQTKVLNDIISMVNNKCVTESIFQIETFIEHEVTELSMF